MTDTQILDLLDQQLAPGEGWFIQRDDAKLWVLRIGNIKALESAKVSWWPSARKAVQAAKAQVDILQEIMRGPQESQGPLSGGASPSPYGTAMVVTTSTPSPWQALLPGLRPLIKPLNKKLTQP